MILICFEKCDGLLSVVAEEEKRKQPATAALCLVLKKELYWNRTASKLTCSFRVILHENSTVEFIFYTSDFIFNWTAILSTCLYSQIFTRK